MAPHQPERAGHVHSDESQEPLKVNSRLFENVTECGPLHRTVGRDDDFEKLLSRMLLHTDMIPSLANDSPSVPL